MNNYLADAQVEELLRPVNPNRVGKQDGMSHMQAYDIRAHLNRVFGFARWSGDVLDTVLLYEDFRKIGRDKDKEGVAVGYRVTYRLTVCAPDGTVLATYTEVATGDGVMPVSKRSDAHDFAVKTAESQALKRCATNLGDGYGLSLYANGSLLPLVRSVLAPKPGHILPTGMVWEQSETATEHLDTQLPAEDERPAEPAPAEPAPVVSESQVATVERLRGDIAKMQGRGKRGPAFAAATMHSTQDGDAPDYVADDGTDLRWK